jgi:MoaA/NifB/PqqE/SkfB family radical SAM enzyme
LTADFNCLSPHDRAGPDLDEIAPAPEALSKAFAYLASEARNPAVSCSPAYIRFVLGQLGAEGAPKRRPVCRAGRLFCYIDTSGDVYPCFDMRGQGRYGNAVRDGVIPALRRIPLMACPRCYCSAAIELNLLAAGTPDSLMNLRKWI